MESSVYAQFYELERDHWWFAGMRHVCRTMLVDSYKSCGLNEDRCLDLGCGTGLWMQDLMAFGPSQAVDFSRHALSFCQARGLFGLTQASAEHLPYKTASFGLITALGLIEHLEDEAAFLAELYRILVPGGQTLLLTSAYHFLWSEHDQVVHHKRRYTKTQLRALLHKEGYEVLRITYVNTVLFFPIILMRALRRMGGNQNLSSQGSPDLYMPGRAMNGLLRTVLSAEAKVLRYISTCHLVLDY